MAYILGIDIGIASVGWAVVNKDYEVVEAGSNIFPAADASENEERRSFRQGRRLKRRQKTRIRDFEALWKKYGFPVPEKFDNDVLKLRNKGLAEKIEIDQIYMVLLNNLKHRGISYLEDALDDNQTGGSAYERALEINREALIDKYPCQIQLERMQKFGQYRGTIEANENGEKINLNNIFTVGAYRKEIQAFLAKQKEFYDVISDQFVQEYFEIFNRKREYYEGPGSEKSRTDYGRFTTKKDPVTGEYITEENIFEKLIGKCSVYTEERRAAGASYTAQEFNVLNDLNNLLVNGRKLSCQEKKEIIGKIKTEKTVDVKKIIKACIGEDIESFEGARIDKNDKEIFHKFEAYNTIRKALDKKGYSIEQFSTDELDIIGEILTLNTEKFAIESAIKRSGMVCDQDVIDILIDVRKKQGSLFSKWQSFSLKIMKELIPEMYEKPCNQMQLLTNMGVFRPNTEKFHNVNQIPVNMLLEDIYNPVVKRSVRITINVINALLKKYKKIDEIVIEMPRDRNTDEEKKRIKDFQRKNEKELKDIIQKIESEYGRKITEQDFRKHKKLTMKLKLWNEQDGICPYSGREITIDTLLDDRDKLEIDHIIPLSISLDDSRSNKVLVYQSENQKKGNRTPYMYLSSENRDWSLEQYIAYVCDLKKKNNISRTKLNNFLFEKNINKIDVVKGFVSRNLNDTRYSSRVVLNSLQAYFRAKDCETKVKVIRGSFTHQMRVNMDLEKNRETSYSHHAVDAMLIAFSQMGYEAYRELRNSAIDFESGEILDEKLWNQNISEDVYKSYLYQKKWWEIKQNIVNAEKKVKYWYRVDKKCNRGLCNQTIRGTREYEDKVYKVNKLKLREDDGYKTFKNMIEKGKENDFLMYRNDPKTFEQLMIIYNEYKDAKNAFLEYENQTGDIVRKYSQKHNGPQINVLKYLGGEVGNCIDISHKYGHEKNSRKVMLESLKPYRTDVYWNSDKQLYYLVGVRYSDICCQKGRYMIDEIKYAEMLLREKMVQQGQDREDLEQLGYTFLFSLYENDIIEYEKNNEIYRERFLSRIKPPSGIKPYSRNHIETKPLTAENFEKRKQVVLAKTKSIKKITCDILGNCYYVENEKFKKVVDK